MQLGQRREPAPRPRRQHVPVGRDSDSSPTRSGQRPTCPSGPPVAGRRLSLSSLLRPARVRLAWPLPTRAGAGLPAPGGLIRTHESRPGPNRAGPALATTDAAAVARAISAAPK